MFYSRILNWGISRVCSISLVAVIVLLYLAFGHSQHPYTGNRFRTKPPTHHHRQELTHSQFVFVCYTLFVHEVALIFPFRLCWGMASLTRRLRKTIQHNTLLQSATYHSSTGGHKNDLDDSIPIEIRSKASRQNVLHAIILPNYKEDIDILRETLDVLACHPQAASSYDVSCAYVKVFQTLRSPKTWLTALTRRCTWPWNKAKVALKSKQRPS